MSRCESGTCCRMHTDRTVACGCSQNSQRAGDGALAIRMQNAVANRRVSCIRDGESTWSSRTSETLAAEVTLARPSDCRVHRSRRVTIVTSRSIGRTVAERAGVLHGGPVADESVAGSIAVGPHGLWNSGNHYRSVRGRNADPSLVRNSRRFEPEPPGADA